MSWAGGITRTTGTVVTASMWNAHLGAGGDLDFLCDGTKIQDGLVAPVSLNSSNAPEAGASAVVVDDDQFKFEVPEDPIEHFRDEIAMVWQAGRL